MLTTDAFWLVEEPVLDEPADLLFPQIKLHIGHDPHDDELGLRALLEMPDAPPAAWWGEEPARDRRAGRRSRRRRSGLATAA